MSTTLNNFYLFNIYEGIFWISLAFVCSMVVIHGVPKRYRFLGIHTTVVLFIFGVTDFIENFVGGFWYHNPWLFLIKAACVLGLVVSIFWYLRVHKRE